uniref:FAM21/CAPZIP domain-containing protein n=1 Tax=Hucho hucho TaxID=62062 RepID=A0A4W5R486_9TELE
MEQEDVGLGDLSSEEMSVDSDRDSVIVREDGKDADQSNDDFEQDEEGPGSIKKKSSMLSDDEDEQGDSDIFGESDEDDYDDRKNPRPSSFTDELAARIKGEPISKPEGDCTSLLSASKKNCKAKKEPKAERPPAIEDDSEELFGLPKMEGADFSPFGGKGGLFSGGRGLFDDDEGDLFSDPPKQPVAEEKITENSLFGTPNDSDSVEGRENGSPAKPNKTQTSAPRKTTFGGLFDDEEDGFFTEKSLNISSSAGQEKPMQKKTVDLFGGDEDGDIFSESSGALPPLQSTREVVEEEEEEGKQAPQKKDHWMSSKHSAGKTGGMKSSDSARYSLPSVKADPIDSLFEDDADLFAATKELSQKKPQRVSLLFEDETEDGEDKGSLFGFKPAINNSSTLADPKAAAVASPAPSLVHTDKPEEVTAPPPPVEKRHAEERVVKVPEVQPLSSPLEGSESKKKPVGGVSLFGGINVLGDRLGAVKTKSPLDETDGDDFLSKEGPPPMEKESKMKNTTVSLFDDEEAEGADWTVPISIPSKPAAKNTLKPAEQRPRTKSSTGVFQDEELLFSHTQQRDNHPDFDIFATPDKSVSSRPSNASSSVKSRPSSVRSAAPTLFSDDDDEDDLFSSVKPKALQPKVSEKPSTPGKDAPSPKPSVTAPVTGSETNLVINPAALLSGASPWILGEVSVLPGLSPSSSGLSPCPAGTQSPSDGGVSLDHPVQVSVLQCANKGRAKGSIRRRPQTRAARQMSAQSSVEKKNQGEDRARPSPTLPHPTQPSLALPNPMHPSLALPNLTLPRPNLPNQAPTTALPSFLPATLPSQSPLTDVSVRPSVLTLPVSNTPLKRDFSKGSKVKVLPSPDKADLFRSDSLFGSVPALAPVPKLTTPSPKLTTKTTEGELTPKEKEATPPSLFDDPMGDLFQKVKPRSAKKAKASSFLEDEEDIFVLGKSSTPTTKITAGGKVTKAGGNSTPKQDLFQDEAETAPKAHKDKSLDASLFDDNVDIFADLTATSKPKETKSKKAETKSIFHDDMDDIFSPSTVKPMAKQPPSKSKKSPLSQDTSAADDLGNIFDHPLNALGGN